MEEVIDMEIQQLNTEIKRLLTEYRLGILSTMKGDQPYSRYMIFRNEDFLLHTISNKKTYKVEDICKNDQVHILLGVDKGCYGQPYLEITATASIHDEPELRQHFWHENFLKYLKGPDDPNYIVIRCKPQKIRLINHPESDGPYTLTLT